MKKSFALLTLVSFFFLQTAPVFALGELPTDTTPPVISGVSATSVSSVSESLVWTTNELAVSTFEYGTTQSYGSSASISAGLAIGGTVTLTNLVPSTAYYYCIHATDASNNVSQSCGSFTTAAAPVVVLPPTISVVAVTSLATSSAIITWTTNTNSDSQVYYGTSSSYGSSSTLNSTMTMMHSVTFSGLTPNTTYHYQVRSRDASNNLTASTDATFTTNSLPTVVVLDTTPPVVSNIVATNVSSVAEDIAWTTNELATSTIRFSTDSSYSSSMVLPETAGLAHTGALIGLVPNTTYNYCIATTDLAGNTSQSCGHTFTTAAAPIVADVTPPVITDVSAISLEPHVATVIWTTDEPATSVLTYGTSLSYGSTASASTSLLLSHSATLLDLQASTTYYYCIHASDLSGNTSASCSSANTFTTPAEQVTLDTIPPTLSLVTVASIATSSATIAWTTSEVANGYVEYGTSANYGSEAQLDTNLALTHQANIGQLSPNTVYHYRVVSSDEAGNISVSPDETFTTSILPVVVPIIPSDINAPIISNVTNASVGSTNATIAWTTNEAAISTLRYGTTTNYGTSATLSASALLVNDGTLTGLLHSTTYYYCIDATDLAGNVGTSCGHSLTTNGPTIVPDTTAPTVSLVTVAPIATSSATIGWVTDELANSQVQYGTNTSYGSQTPLSNLELLGTANLINLLPDTTYHFRIVSSDSSGNVGYSADQSFTTDALPVVVVQNPLPQSGISVPLDSIPPVISGVAESNLLATSTTIVWQTNELATSTLTYGTSLNYGSSVTLGTTALLSHSATLLNLSANTTYYYCVTATDVFGNTDSSCGHSFTTDPLAPIISVVIPPVVETPPINGGSVSTPPAPVVISAVGADSISQNGVTISWTTDMPSDSTVEYGDNMEFDQNATDASLTTVHSVTLTGLDSNTNYDFRVASTPVGVGAVQTVSNTHDFNTLAVPVVIDPAANIISVSASWADTANPSISWITDEPTTGGIEYGLDTSYGMTASTNLSLQNQNIVTLSSLLPNTTYHFRVKAIDSADNITYSEDLIFTTPIVFVPEISLATTTQEVATTTETNSSPSQTSSTPISSGGGGGISISGSNNSSTFSGFSSSAPTSDLVTATGADSQIIFMWNNPQTSDFAGTIIVRKAGSYPNSPSDGQIIYKGNATTFTDTNVQNGVTYYYALYSYNTSGGYSNPLKISTTPQSGVGQVQLNENPVLQPALSVSHFGTDLQFGDQNLEVEHLQQILNTANVHPSGLTTGYFGPLTQAALKTFQAKYNLPQTGVADAATRAVLDSISQSWMVAGAPNTIANLQTDLKYGDSGQSVADLQEFLAYEGSYEEGIISGTYGPLTKESVADFQQKHGVTPVSGYVGYKTRHTIQTVLGL